MTEGTSAAEGTGSAYDAGISDDIPALEAALAEARERAEAAIPARQVAALEAKREKLAAHLAGVEAALIEARRAL